MNRTIQFRGKRIDNGEWVYGYYRKYLFVGKEISEISTIDGECYSVDPETVGQYSGINDRNNKEIYEGDKLLIQIRNFNTGKVIVSGTSVVEYEGCRFGVEWGNNKLFSGLDGFSNTFFEVVGNIHDPHLLEDKQ